MTPDESRAWVGPPGFSTDILPFYEHLANALPKSARFVEVGCFLGRSITFMGTLRPDLDLTVIDTWDEDPSAGYPGEYADIVAAHGGLFLAFLDLVPRHILNRVRILRAPSQSALPMLDAGSVDAIFIDAAHDEVSVRQDIDNARRIVRAGGLITGHDYCGFNPDGSGGNGVVAALSEQPVNLFPWPADKSWPGWPSGSSTCWSFARGGGGQAGGGQ